MRFFKLILFAIVFLAIVGGVGMYFLAGREAGPAITIAAPDKFIGRATPVAITIEGPTPITDASIRVDQNGKPITITDLKRQDSGNKVTLSGTVGRDGLTNGPATLTVDASRKTFYGLRTAKSSTTRELTVRLDPPRVAVIS